LDFQNPKKNPEKSQKILKSQKIPKSQIRCFPLALRKSLIFNSKRSHRFIDTSSQFDHDRFQTRRTTSTTTTNNITNSIVIKMNRYEKNKIFYNRKINNQKKKICLTLDDMTGAANPSDYSFAADRINSVYFVVSYLK
jgi:hypothetical protein